MQSIPSKGSLEIALWTLWTLSVCCLASRLVLRKREKDRLKKSDYILLVASASLLTATALLQSILRHLYAYWHSDSDMSTPSQEIYFRVTSRLTTTMELLWLTVYLVKASFLVQSKFYKPLYAYVSPNLTRYYWASVGICGIGFVFTLTVPIVLCPCPDYCRHTALQDTVPWEITLSTLDILTDLLVISIPLSLACLANFTLSNAIINTLFKSLSVFPIIITVCRMIFQINKEKGQINYLILAFWLAIEAAVAVIMGSFSSYRTAVLRFYATHIRQQRCDATQSGEWIP